VVSGCIAKGVINESAGFQFNTDKWAWGAEFEHLANNDLRVVIPEMGRCKRIAHRLG
jgi:hypothetical protein